MTTLSTRIATLQKERGAAVTSYEAALAPSLAENRDLNDVETTAIDELTGQIGKLDKELDRLIAAETMLARAAQPVVHTMPTDRPGTSVVLATQREHPVIQMQKRDAYKGQDFVRMAIAVCIAGKWNAAEYARRRWGDDEFAEIVQRALWLQRAPTDPLQTPEGTVQTPQQALVRIEHMGSEFIELLRPQLISQRMPNMRRLQFNGAGRLVLPRQTGTVAGSYIGEGSSIIVQRPNFGQLQLVPSKLAVIVPMTTELLDRSDPGIEMLVRDDMVEGTARTINTIWYSTLPAGPGPAGILNGLNTLVPPRPIANAAIPTHDPDNAVNEVTDALKNMILALRMQNVPFTAPVWIFNARTMEYLRLLRTNQQIFAFKAEIDAGTLLGYPIVDSTAIAINGAADTPWPGPVGTTSYALIDSSQLIWAEDMMPAIDSSEHASIVSDDDPDAGAGTPPPVATSRYWSAFQNDLMLLRIRMRHTWARRHDVAVAWAVSAE